MSARLDWLARNQILFREVNERVRELLDPWDGDHAEFVCECSQDACTETIQLSIQEYESIRSHPNRFLVKPGHELLEVERVLNTDARVTLVEKIVEADYAIQTDPRSRAS